MANSVISRANQSKIQLDTVMCQSEDDIDNALRGMISNGFKGIRWLILQVNIGGLSLGGGQWTVLMSQITPLYCTFIAFIYDGSGCVIRGRSLNGGTFSSWKAIS